MKFWKRLTACALTAAMAAGFAGCGSSGGDASKKEDSDKEDAVIPYDSDFTIGVDKIAEAMVSRTQHRPVSLHGSRSHWKWQRS